MTREQVLSQLAIRMSHLFDGDDAVLSSQLEELRQALRRGVDEKDLLRLNNRLSKQIVLQEDKSRQPGLSLEQLSKVFSDQIRALEPNGAKGGKLEALAGEMQASKQLAEQLAILKRVMELLRSAGAPATVKKSGGGLRGLFDRHSAVDSEQREVLVVKASNLLSAVLDHLDILNGSPTETRPVRALLDDSGMQGVDLALEKTASLLITHSERIKEERVTTQSFLGDLREKLLDVEETILSMLEDGGDSLDRAVELEQGVSADVRSIGEAISGEDLSKLHQAVESGLTRLSSRVADYLVTEKDNFQNSKEKIERLNSKLLLMEDEARDLRGQIKDKQDLAIKDPLTGVYNRFGFDERIGEEFARHERMHSPLSLVFVDCNKFKQINDNFGHKAGDTVLLKVAETLSNRARTSDVVARYGGDEFVVILPDTPLGGAQRYAEDASRMILDAGFNNNGKPLDVSISCGVTQVRDHETPEHALERADEAMYKAKKDGSSHVISVH